MDILSQHYVIYLFFSEKLREKFWFEFHISFWYILASLSKGNYFPKETFLYWLPKQWYCPFYQIFLWIKTTRCKSFWIVFFYHMHPFLIDLLCTTISFKSNCHPQLSQYLAGFIQFLYNIKCTCTCVKPGVEKTVFSVNWVHYFK